MNPAPDLEDLPVLTEIVLLGRCALPPGLASAAPVPDPAVPWDAAYAPDAAIQAAPVAAARAPDSPVLWPGVQDGPGLSFPERARSPEPPEGADPEPSGADDTWAQAAPAADAAYAPEPSTPDAAIETGTASGRSAVPEEFAHVLFPVPDAIMAPNDTWTAVSDATAPQTDPEREWETAAVAAVPMDAPTPGTDASWADIVSSADAGSTTPDAPRFAGLAPTPDPEPANRDTPYGTTGWSAPGVPAADPALLSRQLAEALGPWLAARVDAATATWREQLLDQLGSELAQEIETRLRAALDHAASGRPHTFQPPD